MPEQSSLKLKDAAHAGLLGGAVYVNAFTLLSQEIEPEYREFSLGAASLADSLGIALADAAGILIQVCIICIWSYSIRQNPSHADIMY